MARLTGAYCVCILRMYGAQRSPGPAGAGPHVRLSAAVRVRGVHRRDVAAEHRPGLHDARAARARRARRVRRRGGRGGPRHLPAHGRRPRGGRPVVRDPGGAREPAARRAGDQDRHGAHHAGRRRPPRRPDAADRDPALAAGADPAQGGQRRGVRRRLAPGPGVDDLPGRGGGPLARPLRDAARRRAPRRPRPSPPRRRPRRSCDERARASRRGARPWLRRHRGARAARRQPGRRARRDGRRDGPVGLGQVDAAQPGGRARRADLRQRARRGHRPRRALAHRSSPRCGGAASATSSRSST